MSTTADSLPVEAWFTAWSLRHHGVHGTTLRLPKLESGYWAALETELARNGVTRAAADAATTRLLTEPPPGVKDHARYLLRYAAEAMGLNPSANGASSREQAEAASQTCEHCGGLGLTTVYHPTGSDPLHRSPASAASHCSCRMGRWIRARIAASCPDLLPRIPDLAEILAGRTGWLIDCPTLATFTPGSNP